MKKVFMTLTVVAFATSITFAQAPTAKPAMDAAKAAPAKVKEAAKPAVEAAKAAPAKMKEAAKPAMDAAQAAPVKVKKAVKPAMKMPAHSAEVDSAKMSSAKMKKATKAAVMSTSTTMTFKCPKGDALADSGGKCPKCGTEMVAIGASAAPKKAAKKAMKMEAAPVKKEEKKG
jgi:hypothetical protein